MGNLPVSYKNYKKISIFVFVMLCNGKKNKQKLPSVSK